MLNSEKVLNKLQLSEHIYSESAEPDSNVEVRLCIWVKTMISLRSTIYNSPFSGHYYLVKVDAQAYPSPSLANFPLQVKPIGSE